MNIYLKWNGESISDKYNISIFDLKISQEEDCFAKARLTIDALTPLPPAGTEGILYEENDGLLFKGLLIGTLVRLDGSFGAIELMAKPKDFLDKIAALQKKNRISPYWDELWIKEDKHNNFQEIQGTRTASLFCDPRTGELSFSDWFNGKQRRILSQNFFPQSLQMKLIRAPLKVCTINVHVHWIQRIHGITNLSSQIRKIFPFGKMNTYTEKAFLEKWPEEQKRLGRSGIWIIKSKLKPMQPCIPLYPAYSPPLPLYNEGESLKTYRLKRYWFKPTLWVRWQMRQRRKETLSLTLWHDFQALYPDEGEHKTTEFTLQNINPDPDAYAWQPNHFYRQGTKISHENGIYKCKTDHLSSLSFDESKEAWNFKKRFHTPLGHPARSSFFLTDRGYQAAEHAMERAKVILAQSARCLEISFEGLWDELKEVTTDTSLTFFDPRLPGGEVTGKVVKCILIAKGETGERFVCVTLVCAIGSGKEQAVATQPTPTYSLDDYEDNMYQVYENQISTTTSGLSYFRYDHHSQPQNISHGPLLRGVHLINGPQEQETEMMLHMHKTPTVIKKALSRKSTRLQLFFKDLRTKERLDHVITVQMATNWSAPKQVELREQTKRA